MEFVRRKAGHGYYDSYLWLPKTHTSQEQVAAVFAYPTKDDEIIEAWKETPEHYCVPRNYISHDGLGLMPYPIFDTRYKNFPTVDLRSRVTLDAKDPTKTFQKEGSEALLATNDGILCLRCGAGKTVVALHSASLLKTPIIVVVTDDGLAEQWEDEIRECLGLEEDQIGRINGKHFDWQKPVCVALVQSLARRIADNRLPYELPRWFGVAIFDEAHVMGAPCFNTAAPPFQGRRWGLSATPKRDDSFDPLLKYTMGRVVYTYLTPELIPDIWFRQLPTKLDMTDEDVAEQTNSISGDFHYGKTYGYLASLKERTDTIAFEIQQGLNDGRQVLVLSHSKDMLFALEPYFPNAGIIHGDVKGKERFRRIRECNPVISVMQLGKQALNKPGLDTLYLCDPFRKEGVLQQVMGRILRLFSGKKKPVVIVFEDIYIKPLRKLCNNLRLTLARWPANKGGSMSYKILKLTKVEK